MATSVLCPDNVPATDITARDPVRPDRPHCWETGPALQYRCKSKPRHINHRSDSQPQIISGTVVVPGDTAPTNIQYCVRNTRITTQSSRTKNNYCPTRCPILFQIKPVTSPEIKRVFIKNLIVTRIYLPM